MERLVHVSVVAQPHLPCAMERPLHHSLTAWLLEDMTHQCLVSSKIVGRVASGFHLSPSSLVESQVLVFKSM